MSACNGRGECINQCICTCYDDAEYEIPSKVCSCGHRNHTTMIGGDSESDIYCKVTCPHNCKLIECHNYRLCGKKGAQQYLDAHNGMCSDCAIMIGKIKFLDEKDDCSICNINKDMIQISCGKHKVCLECWKNWSESGTSCPVTCPFCRNPIWK